jgi:predicted phage-related endonuclease
MKEYMRDADLRLGSSFDYRIQNGLEPVALDVVHRVVDSPDDAILEIKNVDWLAFKNGWRVEADWIEAPDHIELQVQHQMLVSGLHRAFIAVLVGGNDVRVLEREADEAAFMAIRSEAAAFWDSIANNTPPDPTMPDDADAVIRLNQYAAPGRLLDARGDAEIATLVRLCNAWKKEAAHAEEEATVLKAQILQRIGEAEKAIVDCGKISAGMVAPSRGTLVTPEMVGTYIGGRGGYRMLRITMNK